MLLYGAFLVTELWMLELEPVRFGADSWGEQALQKAQFEPYGARRTRVSGSAQSCTLRQLLKMLLYGAFLVTA